MLRVYIDNKTDKNYNYWSKVDKEDYLLAIERSPIRTIEIKHVLKEALTDNITSRNIYMKGVDYSYYYEGYYEYKTMDLED